MSLRNFSRDSDEHEIHETLVLPLVQLFIGVILLLLVATAFALADPPRHLDLYCHRTANQDVLENTLESLE